MIFKTKTVQNQYRGGREKNINERFLVLLQLVYFAFPYYHIHTYASIIIIFFNHTLIIKLTKFLRLIT